MKKVDQEDIRRYVYNNIEIYHSNRIAKLRTLKLEKILKRKNPYLYRAKNVTTAQEIVQWILEAHLSSEEETSFGDFLEGLAIYVAGIAAGGRKSTAEGIDLEIEKGATKYIISIKSGPNWGNSQAIKRMSDNFLKAQRILRTSGGVSRVIAINGCCYGIDNNPDKGAYLKLCGQRFWFFLSGDENLYTEIVEPLGFEAKERNEAFLEEYGRIINNFTKAFLEEFCTDGNIEWEKLVQKNSMAKAGTLAVYE